jgi:hypothetical protein
MTDDDLDVTEHQIPSYKLPPADAALLVITHCRCLTCDYRWRESALMFRTANGYSYDQTQDRLSAIANRSLSISGRRLTSRVQGACQSCVAGPRIRVWEGRIPRAFEEPHVSPTGRTRVRQRRTGDKLAQTALINSLFED